MSGVRYWWRRIGDEAVLWCCGMLLAVAVMVLRLVRAPRGKA